MENIRRISIPLKYLNTEKSFLNFNLYKYIREVLTSLGIANPAPKIYRAVLSQSGTSAPTATVLENTLGVTPTYAYIGTGDYTITATSTFTVGKTFVNLTNVNSAGATCRLSLTDVNSIRFFSVNDASAGANALMTSTFIEILVYP